MRRAEIQRNTKETKIQLTLNLDGKEEGGIDTGIGFFDHMLNSFAVHSGFGLSVKCEGDLEVDDHHSIEDVGIVLGQAFAKLTEDKTGLARYGSAIIPLDEALTLCAVDISNRPYLVFDGKFEFDLMGDMETQMVKEFFYAFAIQAKVTLHIRLLSGENDHHKAESMFKAFAHAMKAAVKKNAEGELLSSKGLL